MKDVYYFRHDSNARNDEKVLELLVKYQWQGYGLYMAVLEMMREGQGTLEHGKINGIAFHLHVDASFFNTFINDCIETFGLFKTDKKTFWSERMLNDIKAMHEKRDKASRSANFRWHKEKKHANAEETHSDSNAIKVNKGKVNKGKVSEERLKEARDKLTEMLKPFITDANKEELNKFWLYWTEPNKSLTKLRWQMEKTWEISRRINTWMNNAKK